MWGNAHDEYGGGNPNKANKNTNPRARQMKRAQSQKKINTKRPKPKNQQKVSLDDTHTHTKSETETQTDPTPTKHKFRGRGTSKPKANNPWTHAHDEYAAPKNKKRTQSSENPNSKNKSKRPVRIRFEGSDDFDNDNHPEEKSNRPLDIEEKSNRPINMATVNANNQSNTIKRQRIKRRPKKKPNYVSAANMHAQQFGRSGYRGKPLPPNPSHNRPTNQQRVASGQANFEAMVKQAAIMEGLDKSDPRVHRMIQRLGENLNEVRGFNRFLQNHDEEMGKKLAKQDKRIKQMNKVQKSIAQRKKQRSNRTLNTGQGNERNKPRDSAYVHQRKQSVKDMAQRYEKAARNRRTRQKPHRNQGHRNALKLPNTKAHRRRVSSNFSVAAISAVINQQNNPTSVSHSPFLDDNNLTFPNTNSMRSTNLSVNGMDDNASDISFHNEPHLVINRGTRTASRGSRASFSHGSRASAVPSVILMKGPHGSDATVLISTPGADDGTNVTPSIDGTYAGDPLLMLIRILKREPIERSEEELDMLVHFFENYQIMTEDVDTWSGQATFRSFIQQTRYRYVPETKSVFNEGDDGDVFYFVLRGNVSVLVDEAGMVHSSSKRNVMDRSHKQEIHVVEENHVFGEIAMFNQGKRSATCVAKTDTHLAFWDRQTYDEFIRPMKELKKKAQKILRDKSGNMLSEDQLIEKAAMFLDDAMHGRELKMHRNGPWPRRIHKLINHKYFNYCLVMVSMLWLSLIFIEPPSYRDSLLDDKSLYFYRVMPLIAFEWFVFLIFAGECLLRFYSFGSQWFFTIDLHVMRVVLLVIFFADLMVTCVHSGHSFRFSRVIRPIFPVLFIRDLRRQYYIVLSCVPYIMELMILWCIIAAIFARIAYHIFYHSEDNLFDGHTRQSVFMKHRFAVGDYPYDDKMSEYCTAALTDDTMKRCDQFFDDFVFNSFDTFFHSLIALFALLTTENFPEVWWPTWVSNEGKPYWTFFLIYALIAVFFMMNLFAAAVYDAYQHIISQMDVIDEKRETQALKVAWICLDTSDFGAIGPQKFENLMCRLKPEYTDFEIGVIFKLLDPDNNHLIDAEDFSIMMINVLYLSISRKTRSKEDELKLYLQKLGGACPCGYEILKIFTGEGWRYFMLIVQSLDICALLSYHQKEDVMNYIDFICVVLIIFALIIDVIFKHMSQWKQYFKSSKNRLYFGLTLIQSIGTFIGIVDDRQWISSVRFFGILRMLIVAVFALEKVKYLRTSLTRTLTQTVIFMIPVFLRIVLHISIVLLYMYTIIGIEVFVDPDPETWGKSRCNAPQQMLSNPYALFCDANMTMITLIQILTTNNWHTIMYTAIEVTDNWFNALYFITFFFFGPILVVSLLLAMFFNMFFGISVQSENDLASFFQETDTEAQMMKDQMELQQNIAELNEFDADQRHAQEMPTEVGIHTMDDGTKILTFRRFEKSPLQKPLLHNDDTLVEPQPSSPNSENEAEEVTMNESELIHIPLLSVARQIWENVPGSDWVDQNTNDVYHVTFNGKEATNYLLSAQFAPDGEEAVDYLALIMDEIGAFMRVDAGQEQTFVNDETAHYQWIFIPEEMDEEAAEEMDEDEQVALSDIMIGFRHSYGGYHRLLKQYRQAGIDPAQEAAQKAAAKHAVTSTPLSELGTPTSAHNTEAQQTSPKTDTETDTAVNSATDLVKVATKHMKNRSMKLLEEVTMKLKKTDSVKEEKEGNEESFDDSEDDQTVINCEQNTESTKPLALASIRSGVSDNEALPQSTKSMYSQSTTNFNKKLKQGSDVEMGNIKSITSPTTNMTKSQSNGFNDFKRAKTMPTNNEAEDTIAPLGTFKSINPGVPGLQKSKSVKGGTALSRSASSKNILLRHLDKKKSTKKLKGNYGQ